MDVLTAKTSGLEQLRSYFARAPQRVANPVKQSLAAAARIGAAALRAEARKHDARGVAATTKSGRTKTTHLADTATFVARRYGDTQYVAVGFSYPFGAHGWLVDRGHRMVTGGTIARPNGRAPKGRRAGLTGAGRVVGQAPPHPIARPAFDSAVGRMQEAFRSALSAGQ